MKKNEHRKFGDLKVSDVPTSKDSSVKQQEFALSLGAEIYSKKGKENSKNFRKKYNTKKYDKITIEELKTMLIGYLRAIRHSGSQPDKEFLDKIFELFKEKIREKKNV